jgi:hypothetical protein
VTLRAAVPCSPVRRFADACGVGAAQAGARINHTVLLL